MFLSTLCWCTAAPAHLCACLSSFWSRCCCCFFLIRCWLADATTDRPRIIIFSLLLCSLWPFLLRVGRSVCSLGMCYKRINMHFDLCPDWCHFLIPSIYMNVLLPTGTGSIVPDTVCAEFMPKAFCVSTTLNHPHHPFTTTATTIEKWWTKKYVCPGSSSIDNKFFFIEGFGLNCGGRQASRQTKTDNSLLLSHESPLDSYQEQLE